jgi:hypothetical protein
MQLAKKLGVAVGTLLSGSQAHAADWLYDASFMSYSEKDSQQQDRVTVFEPVLSITRQKTADDFTQFELVYDSLTGASPNGANASSQVQNFNSYSVLPGYTPLDPSFNDKRTAVNINWMQPIDHSSRYQAGMSYSTETDYNSVGGSYSYLEDFNNKRTTLTLGGAYTYDAVNPHGGFHDPFTSIYAVTAVEPVQTTTSASGGNSSGEGLFPGKIKQTFEGLFGVTQVLNRLTLLNLNYSISQVSGYLTDPYKIISVIDSGGFPVDYLWENRPDSRLKQTIKGTYVTAIGADSLHLDYRYYWDDWGITADTYDVEYHMAVTSRLYFEPHVRHSQQNQADFFHISLTQGQALPTNASADYRLADMTTKTYGAMFGYRFNPKLTLTFNVDQITQTGDNHPPEAIGDQRVNDMFPELKMWALTFGISGKW